MVYARNPKQERALLARQLRAQGRTWAEIAGEFRRRYSVSPRAALRMARGWSQRQAAEEWNSRWPEPLRTAKHISSWETWPTSGHTPSFDTLDKLAQLYECDVADLLADLPGYRSLDDAHGSAPDQVAGPAAVPAVPDTAARRPVEPAGLPAPTNGSGTPTGTDAAAPVGVQASVALADWATASNVDEATLDHLGHRLRVLAGDLCHQPPVVLQERVQLVQSRVLSLLTGHQGWRQTQHLYLLGARTSTLLAWLATATGEYGAAEEHLWAAWRCAHQAEDDDARAWVYITQARLAYWRDDAAASARFATQGQALATRAGDEMVLTLLAARAWAQLGRHDLSTDAVDRWRVQLAERPGTSSTDADRGVPRLTPPQQHYLAGSALLLANRPVQALDELNLAIEMFDTGPPDDRCFGAEMGARVNAAHAYVAQGDLDGAAGVIEPMLVAADEDRCIHPLVQRLAHLRRALGRPRFRSSAIAGELEDRIAAYSP